MLNIIVAATAAATVLIATLGAGTGVDAFIGDDDDNEESSVSLPEEEESSQPQSTESCESVTSTSSPSSLR